MDTEAELIAGAAGGDQGALERLLMAYYDRLIRRIDRRLPSSLARTISAEDILQQTLIAVSRDIATFRPGGPYAFYRWQCGIAEHRMLDAINAHRALKRGGGRSPAALAEAAWTETSGELIDLLSAPLGTPSQSVARREGTGAIRVALASIPEDYRRALQLRYIQGKSVEETAQSMDRSPRAVHNLCHRGLRALHLSLGRTSLYLSRR